MIKDYCRVCDVCGCDIPKGDKYKKARMPSEKATIFFDGNDPDIVPTFSQTKDNEIEMDICVTCTLSMGFGGEEQSNQRPPICLLQSRVRREQILNACSSGTKARETHDYINSKDPQSA